MDALIVVDVQNDFCPGGALAVPRGDEVIEPVNRLAAGMPLVFATRDWHPRDHGSFASQGGPWPEHCVEGTEGAQLHPGLRPPPGAEIVDKGQDRDTEGYSAFEGTGLESRLREAGATRVHVAGLALDYCVKHTALDARRHGFDVVIHRDATRAVDVRPGDGERALEELRAAGVEVAP
jgi:nicotinamidase/pyrazinamidase